VGTAVEVRESAANPGMGTRDRSMYLTVTMICPAHVWWWRRRVVPSIIRIWLAVSLILRKIRVDRDLAVV
jgi:hypothetical protein